MLNSLIEQITALTMIEKDKKQQEIYFSIRKELINYNKVIVQLKLLVYHLKDLLENIEGEPKNALLSE